MSEAELSIGQSLPSSVDASADVVVVGAGACGLTAALRASASGAGVIVLERDASPSGSTSMSSGFVPAPATRYQKSIGIDDDAPDRFFADLRAKSRGQSVESLARLASETIGPAIDWLGEAHGIEWRVLDDFLYPGHSRHRMHAVPEKTGAALLASLLAAAEARDIPVVTNARATTLFLDGKEKIAGVGVTRSDGARETIGCKALILACNGYGGNAGLVSRYIPEIASGPYYGHPGNTGDAVLWGEKLGADVRHLSGYQGHGSLAHPHNILISWALMGRGAVQINAEGRRFSNESGGYSEQAVSVLRQPGGVAWNVYDNRIHAFGLTFPDYREADAAGAILRAADLSELAARTRMPEQHLTETLQAVEDCRRRRKTDPFGRDFSALPALERPYRAVRITGALFHTQGGLVIDDHARVLAHSGRPFSNLFAGGGAACGVSGPDVSGYLSGNGLLTAIAFGYLAGESAAQP